METWPSIFPLPSANYSTDSLANTARTQMESGKIRSRLRSRTESVTINVNWELSDLEFTVFVAFVKHKLKNGSEWFRIEVSLGDGIVEHVCRFVDGKYGESYIPVGFHSVTAQLEVEERKVISNDILDVYIAVGFSDVELKNFLDSVERAWIFTTQTLPDLTA